MMNAPQPIPISVQKASAETLLAVNFSLIMPDVITEVLSSLFTGKTINELLKLVSSDQSWKNLWCKALRK